MFVRLIGQTVTLIDNIHWINYRSLDVSNAVGHMFKYNQQRQAISPNEGMEDLVQPGNISHIAWFIVRNGLKGLI